MTMFTVMVRRVRGAIGAGAHVPATVGLAPTPA